MMLYTIMHNFQGHVFSRGLLSKLLAEVIQKLWSITLSKSDDILGSSDSGVGVFKMTCVYVSACVLTPGKREKVDCPVRTSSSCVL